MKLNYMHLLTSPKTWKNFKEIFKQVVMQKCLLDQIGKVGVELKISNGQEVFLHESDVETSHDIPKFW